MADLEQSLEELDGVKQSFKANINNAGISTSNVEFRNMPNLINQMEKKLPNQTKNINPTTSEQVVTADSGYKLTQVNVKAVVPSDYYKPEEVANVTPTTNAQVVTPSANAVFNQVNVSAVTSAIDENIKAENIKKDVAILGVVGTMEATGGSPKFAELVDGSIVSVESGDLADVTMIRDNAFANLTNLTSAVIPSNIATIGEGAFMGCSNLQTLLMAEGVQSIGANAFNGINASVIDIPSSVITIGEGAFANNTAITSVTIPSGVTELPANLFSGCTGLTEVTMEATTPPSVTDTTFPDNVTAIYVPSGTYYTYVESWGYYADKIVTDFDVEEIPNETGITLNIISNDYRETLNEQNGYTLEIGG